MIQPFVVLSCQDTPDSLNTFEQELLGRCRDHGLDCLLIPHIYHLAESSPVWEKLAQLTDPWVLACWLHPRPAEWILRRHKVDVKELTILNLGSFASPRSAMLTLTNGGEKELSVPSEFSPSTTIPREAPSKIESLSETIRKRWYPVIDGSRCIQCQHCLQFCLFGVYEFDEQGKVEVRRPQQCKSGCPACSRICPQSAIMFPLHEKEGAIAGAPGQFVVLDLTARRMYYQRTQLPCTKCGRRLGRTLQPSLQETDICPECGALQPKDPAIINPNQLPASAPHLTPPPAHQLFDDLDELVDQLDRQMRRSN